ncbi:C39 family peptidase [Haliscomenobacter sp.]|uniref:C39 family peptidase n=1 Tax=Haliscomenobacter sp. TaxID=2717303 RepID=UPI003364EA97
MKRLWFVLIIVSLSLEAIGQIQEIDSFPMVKQRRSQWCWAACAEMVDSFFPSQTKLNQCDFALMYLNSLYKFRHNLKCPFDTAQCSEMQNNSTGNVGFSFSSKYFGIRFEQLLSRVGFYSSFEKRPSIDEIKNEIDHDRPLIAFVSTAMDTSTANHVVVVKGYRVSGTDTYLILNDPWFHSSNNACSFSSTLEFNYTGTNQTGSIKSIIAFQMNIHPKYMLLSEPPSFRRTSNILSPREIYSAKIDLEDDTIRIPVKILSIEKIKSIIPRAYANKFYQNESYELYSPSAKRSYVYENTNKGWTLTEIKSAHYPVNWFVSKGKDTLLIKGFKEANVTIWQYPLAPFHYFYEFQINGKTKVAPLSDVNQKNGTKLESGVYYRPKVVMNRLRKHNRFFFGIKHFPFFGKKKVAQQ